MINTEKRLEPFAHHQPDGDDTVFTKEELLQLQIEQHLEEEEAEREEALETYEVVE